MLFMCHGTPKPGLTVEDRRKVVELFRAWTPPAGLDIKAHYVDATGGDYVIVETSTAEALLEATAMWAPYVEYAITPLIAVTSAVERIASAEQTRQQLL